MNKKLNKLLLVIAALALTSLTGCGNSVVSAKEAPKAVNSDTSDSSASSVWEAVSKLASSKNYTIHVKTKTGPLLIENNMYYTENAFYDDYLGDEYGYVKCDDGVYRFDRYNRVFTPSGLLTDAEGNKATSVWDQGYFYGFSSLDLSEFQSADGTTYSVSKKKNKLAFMKIFSIDQTNYMYVQSIDLKLTGSDVNSLTFSVTMSNSETDSHECVIQNFGTTKIDYLEKQLAKGKTYYTPSGSMAKVIDLFSNYNYTHFLYEEEDDYDINQPYGWEKYCKDYWIEGFTEEYLKENTSAILYCSGMIGFDNEEVTPYKTLNGSYYTYYANGSFSMITSMAYNSDPFVPNVYNYPTFLLGLSESQYFDVAGDENTYYTTKLSILSDFCTNFQLWDSLSSLGVTPTGLYISYSADGYNGEETVTFSLEYSYYGYLYTSDFVFSDFNKTKEEALEKDNVLKYLKAFYEGQVYWLNLPDGTYKQMTPSTDASWMQDEKIAKKYSTQNMYTLTFSAGDTIDFSMYDATKDADFETANSSSEVAHGRATAITYVPSSDPLNDDYYYDEATSTYKVKNDGKAYLELTQLSDGTYEFLIHQEA